MLSQLIREVKSKNNAGLLDQRKPLIRYLKDHNQLMIRETSKKLNLLHLEAVKIVISDHLNQRSQLDIVLQLNDVKKENLPLLFDLFKYCEGIQQWDKEINISWYMPLNQSRTTEIAQDFKELYNLNLRIFHIS